MKVRSTWQALRAFLLGAILVLGVAACGSDGGGGDTDANNNNNNGGLTNLPVLEVDPVETCQRNGDTLSNCSHVFDQSQVFDGESITWTLRIRNTGSRDLKIRNIALEYEPMADGETPPAFALQVADAVMAAVDGDGTFAVATSGNGTEDKPEDLAIGIVFTRYDDEFVRSAKLVLDTDASNVSNGKLSLDLTVSAGFAKIQVEPDWVNFGQVGMNESSEERITILNTGSSDLVIDSFTFNGSEYFTLIVQGTEYVVGSETAAGVDLGEYPVVVEPQKSTFFKVRFEPLDEQPATGTLVLHTNDPTRPEGVDIKVTGNEEVPCIEINPPEVNFGGKKYGEEAPQEVKIRSCGETPLEIYGIRVKEGSSLDFGVVLTNYNGQQLLDHEPTETDPVIIPIGSEASIIVTFVPDAPNELDGNGNMILDEGDLIITNNSFQTDKEVHLSGAGVEIECPTAVIRCAEGDEVIPQTLLHLFGDESYAGNGQIEKWEWGVEQPAGSQSVFVPSHTFPNPTFETNVAGSYMFMLDVWDQTGVRSCIPATYEVLVIPDEAIHIELLWHTPEDMDESDTGPEAGSDLDLHFLHPWAAGPDLDADGAPDGWFDNLFDCFWFNAHPNWGSYDPAINDDPGLDRDDTDGAGPENVNLDIPEENVTYRVGVHYWNDHSYGPSYATVRVYIYAYLVFE